MSVTSELLSEHTCVNGMCMCRLQFKGMCMCMYGDSACTLY